MRRKRSGSCCRRRSSPRLQPRHRSRLRRIPCPGRDRGGAGRAPRRQRSGAGGDRAPARQRRCFSACAGGARTPDAPRFADAPKSDAPQCRGRAGASAAAAADHGLRALRPPASPMVRLAAAGRLMPPMLTTRAVRRRRPRSRSRARSICVPKRRSRRCASAPGGAEDVLSTAKSVFHAVLPK